VITDNFKDKKILIWGYGREGKSTEKWLKTHTLPACTDIFEGTPGEMASGRGREYDIIVKSPGIVWPPSGMENDPGIESLSQKMTSQTEIFISEFRESIVGITGTKGKSTTSSMLAHVLSKCLDRKVILAGNIGLPCLDYYDDAKSGAVVVLELSCHQLKNARTSPKISVFLDLYEEHLDYYGSLEAYFRAKSHIVSNQKKGDRAYIGENVPEIASESTQIRVVPAPSELEGIETELFGEHNRVNAFFVKKICMDEFGIPEDKILEALKSFEALPHRMKKIGTYSGINWYDDSISTIPEAAISACESIPDAQVILIGGMDRGISYKVLEDYIKEHKEYRFICMYATGKRIVEEGLMGLTNVCLVEDLKEAVDKAFEMTDEGKGCVLSPAAASYGYFKNFEERGDAFARLVKEHGSD